VIGIDHAGSVLLDVAGIAATVGIDAWNDPRWWNLAKLPFSPDFLPLYCDHVARLIGALYGKSRKCLVVDLDNTIWELQRALLDLHSRGVVLAVCSKNDESIARAAFRDHPDMLLKETHFAVFQANWEDKSRNLRAIAEKLNLGLDAVVFVDDNPAERQLIRHELPAVAVPELPDDPAFFTRALLSTGYFESIRFTDDDRKRNEQYRTNAQRADLANQIQDLASYLRSLDMTIEFRPFTPIDRPRITQLINKTNQFNVTTPRYTEAQIKGFEEDPAVAAFQVRLTDRFGDNGLISVIICREQTREWQIDTWLMSCRTLKRQVEHFVLNKVVDEARRRGISELIGAYIPTERNGLVRDLFADLGFTKIYSREGVQYWRLNVNDYVPFAVPINESSVLT
jgi:FkbH-like protein